MSVLKRYNGSTWETVGPGIIDTRVEAIENIIAPEYDPLKTYKNNDYVVKNNILYRCKNPITSPEAWTNTHWLEVQVMNEVGYLQNAFIKNSITNNNINIFDAAGDNTPFNSLKLFYDYNSSGISKATAYITQNNLFGGEELKNIIQLQAPGSIIDEENKTITFSGAAIRTKELFKINFKENTQYTIILYGRNTNSSAVYTNINFEYTDGTAAGNQIRFSTAGENSYAIFTSAANKTLSAISGIFVQSETILYYNNCGLFEGAAAINDFEPYIGQKLEVNISSITNTFYGGTIDFISGQIISTKNPDGTDLITPIEYNTTPQRATTFDRLNKINSNANTIYIEYFINTKSYIDDLSYDPDDYEGSDSEKLQQCFDALTNIGGNIILKRTYTLSQNLIINNNSDEQRFIRVIGYGKDAKINCGSYKITGPTSGGHAFGGILWSDVAFDGSSVGFDAGILIRLWFFHCSFKGFNKVFSADSSEQQSGETRRYIQTLYLDQCTIKGCGTGIYINGGAYNMGLHQCLIENISYAVNNVDGSLMGVRIYDCVIEAVWSVGIRVNGNGASLTIDNNYFEANPQCIFIGNKTGHRSISIQNNYFVANGKSAIFIDPATTDSDDRIKGIISGNTFLESTHTYDFVKFITTPVIPQTWKIIDNYPNTVENAGNFLISSNNIISNDFNLNNLVQDGYYINEDQTEIIQVISAGLIRLQLKFNTDQTLGTKFSFRMQNINLNTWSNWREY